MTKEEGRKTMDERRKTEGRKTEDERRWTKDDGRRKEGSVRKESLLTRI